MMANKLLKRTAALVATASMCLAVVPAAQIAAQAETDTVNAEKIYSVDNKYNYRLSESLGRSPDTFEAWINIPQNSSGGVIMGNYEGINFANENCTNWEIDPIGRFRVRWNNKGLVHTFPDVFFNDGQWHHVALVRDGEAGKFVFYVDGELGGEVSSRQKAAVSSVTLDIGVDRSNWSTRKKPLDGRIKSVALYDSAMPIERIRADMDGIADDADGKLMGFWDLGENWTKQRVADSFGSGVTATLHTFEKYVTVMPLNEYDYSIVGMPDIQTMVHYKPDNLTHTMNWLAENAEARKMQFMVQVGDLSDVGDRDEYYRGAANALDLLDGKLPYTFVQGNHDYDENSINDRGSTRFDKYFPYSKHSKSAWFGGAYEEGTMANTYSLFDVGDVKYLVLSLEFAPRKSVLRWAGRVCEMYPDRRVIISTHDFVSTNGEFATGKFSGSGYFRKEAEDDKTDGLQMWNGLVKKYPNIFLVLNGHECADDIVMRRDKGDHGNTVTSMLIDAQCVEIDGGGIGEDVFLMMYFNETFKTIDCVWYSPLNDKCFNIQNQFTLDISDEFNPAIGKR